MTLHRKLQIVKVIQCLQMWRPEQAHLGLFYILTLFHLYAVMCGLKAHVKWFKWSVYAWSLNCKWGPSGLHSGSLKFFSLLWFLAESSLCSCKWFLTCHLSQFWLRFGHAWASNSHLNLYVRLVLLPQAQQDSGVISMEKNALLNRQLWKGPMNPDNHSTWCSVICTCSILRYKNMHFHWELRVCGWKTSQLRIYAPNLIIRLKVEPCSRDIIF